MTYLRIYCCENLGGDVKALLRGGCLVGAQCRTFESRCGRPPVTWGEVRRICGGGPSILVGGECLAHLGPAPDDLRRVHLLKRPHCTALICGEYSFARLTAAGSYLVTTGWLANWRSIVAGWGFDRSTGAEFFAESCARITLLDTGSDPDAEAAFGELGDFVQRPVELLPVGLELLTLQLEKARGELERQEQAWREGHAASASDYALLLDMLSKISGSSGHDGVIDEMLAFFSMLFGAGEAAFIPARKDAAIRRHGFNAGDDLLLRELADQLQEPYYIEAAAGCFMVCLSHNGVVGWLWVGGFATPQHLHSYLNLAVTGRAIYQNLAGEGIQVWLSLEDELWKVRIDPPLLEEIVSNIVRNAGAAMPGGGALAIATSNVTLGEEECSANVDAVAGDYVECTIADSGHGMDQETCRHIFEPFFTTREVGQGSGLGLATVYGMVTQNGGFVNVSSERGVGTTLRVYLPRFQDRVVEAGRCKWCRGRGRCWWSRTTRSSAR